MKNKTKKILCAIIFMAVVSIALVLVLNTEQFRTSQLEKQLSGKYGVRQQNWHVVRTDKKNLTTSIGDVMYKKTMFKNKKRKTEVGKIYRTNTG